MSFVKVSQLIGCVQLVHTFFFGLNATEIHREIFTQITLREVITMKHIDQIFFAFQGEIFRWIFSVPFPLTLLCWPFGQ